LVTAGLLVLRQRGAAELTVRRVAEVADSSTMGIYTGFGGRAGMLEAIYRRGFELLQQALTTADSPAGPVAFPERVLALTTAYREFALGNPALYSLMFERPLPDFDPSHELRSEALAMTFGPLVDAVTQAQRAGLIAGDDPIRPSYLVWTAIHGIVSIELTHAARTPLPGWFLDSPQVGYDVLVDGVRAMLTGLG
jgi:AcrR family transcriptional regulator